MAGDDWIKRQAKDATKRAKDRAGSGWGLLGKDLQEGLVSYELVMLNLAQAEESLVKNPGLRELNLVARVALDM